MKTIASITLFVMFAFAQTAFADGVTAWCGNGCSSDPDEPSGISCTDWGKATGSSVCQAKAICSQECTVWVSELNRNLDLLLVESEQDLRRVRRKLEGAMGVRIVSKEKLFPHKGETHKGKFQKKE